MSLLFSLQLARTDSLLLATKTYGRWIAIAFSELRRLLKHCDNAIGLRKTSVLQISASIQAGAYVDRRLKLPRPDLHAMANRQEPQVVAYGSVALLFGAIWHLGVSRQFQARQQLDVAGIIGLGLVGTSRLVRNRELRPFLDKLFTRSLFVVQTALD